MSKKTDKKFLYVGVLAIPFVLIGSLFSAGLFTVAGSTDANSNLLHYYSNVCEDITRADGSQYTLPCHHNFFSTSGRNMVMDILGGATPTAAWQPTRIILGNDTNSAGMVQTYFDSGLVNASGTFTKVADPGNWSISNTFTASANSKQVNATGLFNGTSSGPWIYFAGNNFTQVTLNNNDQITIRWNISIA